MASEPTAADFRLGLVLALLLTSSVTCVRSPIHADSMTPSADALQSAAVSAPTSSAGPKWQTKMRIGFLPAMTDTNRRLKSKYYVGALPYALTEINALHASLGYPQLEYMFHDTHGDTSESLRAMTAMYMNGTAAFIGPGLTCAVEARLAGAWNLPLFAFVSMTRGLR